MGIWQIGPAGRCPRCLEPVGLVRLADGRRYRCSLPPRLLNAGLDLDHAHERPAAHDAECPGVPRPEVAFAQWAARVTQQLTALEDRLAPRSDRSGRRSKRAERAERAESEPRKPAQPAQPAPVGPDVPGPSAPRRRLRRGTPIVLDGGDSDGQGTASRSGFPAV
jgi:hypothetical protein